jgi:asparagine synthase (glutamine-hydrolysing)
LLKKLSKKVLPPTFDFQRKQGFVPPLDEWFKLNEWKTFIMDHLSDSNALFNQDMVNNIFKGMQNGHYNQRRIFIMIMMQLWSNNYKINL